KIGAKLIDSSIDTARVFENVITPEEVTDRPAQMPIALEWYEDFLSRQDDRVFLEVGGETVPLFDVEMDIVEAATSGPIRFEARAGASATVYEMVFSDGEVAYLPALGSREAMLTVANNRIPLGDWLARNHPTIRFDDGSFLQGNELGRLRRQSDASRFRQERLITWAWDGIDITSESQGPNRQAGTVQRRVLDVISAYSGADRFDVIFDDDGTGEIADIVAIRSGEELIEVHLFHCKYSGETQPGARVSDFYEVCGQAQKSVFWAEELPRLCKRIRLREQQRLDAGHRSRFERGDLTDTAMIGRRLRKVRSRLKIHLVQPGLSATRVTPQILELLASTELYLTETFGVQLEVVVSP
ncbi:MAG: hypothetical protein WC655_27680, partial [Candidatus Hydrogenedentales bacterium]